MSFSVGFKVIEERFVALCIASVIVVDLAAVVLDVIPAVLEAAGEVVTGFSVLSVPCFAGLSLRKGTVSVVGIIGIIFVVSLVGIFVLAVGVLVFFFNAFLIFSFFSCIPFSSFLQIIYT